MKGSPVSKAVTCMKIYLYKQKWQSFELLPFLIPFASLWHAGRILDKNDNMNYSYPTKMYESILAQMFVFLVLFTIFAFYYETI